MKMGWISTALVATCSLVLVTTGEASAAGTLTPKNSNSTAPTLVDHQVHVVLNNGFARTEVTQTFDNPNEGAVDAVYEFPVPEKAALSEMTIVIGERTMHGEVLASAQAQTIYDAQKDAGAQAGLATKNTYQTFQFDIANVPAHQKATMTFVYYEPLTIDTAVGRYLYPLEDGGTRTAAETAFWTRNETVSGTFTFDLELKSALAIEEVRLPGYSPDVKKLDEGHYTIHLETNNATLNQDVVFYYRLPDNLPGRVEMIPYRPQKGGPGTFMTIVTPGIDLAPLTGGHDSVFVLDVSGSMASKLPTLISAVSDALQKLAPEDRFRIIAFSDNAWDVNGGLKQATTDNVQEAITAVHALHSLASTNLYDGLTMGLTDLGAERVSQVLLVTDGVANTGVVDPIQYFDLLRDNDARVFGFLLGNNANWPLMDIITDASGGFYAPVSNQDDILGQILLAESKITHQSMHDAKLAITGVNVHDTTDFDFGKVYRGQQLVIFGRYDDCGAAELSLAAKISGKPETYVTSFAFPTVAEDNPELERLWALDMIHALERQRDLGLMPAADAAKAIRDLGIAYQLVTDETSMVVVDDKTFEKLGIDRSNEQRTTIEQAAQQDRAGQPPVSYGVGSANPSGGSSAGRAYGGALSPWSILVGMSALGILGLARRSRRDDE